MLGEVYASQDSLTLKRDVYIVAGRGELKISLAFFPVFLEKFRLKKIR